MWYKIWSAKSIVRGSKRRIELHIAVDSKKASVVSAEFFLYSPHGKGERLETVAINAEDLAKLRSALYAIGRIERE